MSLMVKDPNTGQWKKITGGGGEGVDVDSALSPTSTNPVQNKVITAVLSEKQDDMQMTTMPDPADYTNRVVIYTGEDTADYTKGHSYLSDGSTWSGVGGGSGDAEALTPAQMNALLDILN